jgi:FSR family fosmidomycin resistance protein-like MFS transporter
MNDNSRANVKIIFSLTLVHFIGDFYFSFVIPLLPVLVDKLSLTLTQVGLLTGISRLLAFVVQPSVGYIADHYRTRLFVLGGPLLATISTPLVGVVPGFFLLILCVSFGAIGTSMFHPTTAAMIPSYSGRHFGFSMSVFNMGGTLAFALGPLFITSFVAAFGLESCPLTMILGLVTVVILTRIVPFPEGEGLGTLGFIGSIKEALGAVWKSVMLIWIVMVLRSFVSQSFLTFIPLLLARQGHSLLSVGTMVSLFTLAGALSGLLAGHLSDRIGYKPIFFVTHGLATPCLYLLIMAPSRWVYPGAFLAGFFVLATLPVGLAMAQRLAPRGKSMVSSLMMGLAYGLGGMLTGLTGKLADVFGIQPVLSWLAILPLLTVWLIAFVRERR